MAEEYPLMLSKKLKDRKDLEKLDYPVYVEPKYDGIRAVIIKEKDKQVTYTRYKNRIDLPQYDLPDGVYDTEIIKPGVPFNVASGEIRKGDLSNIRIMVFDYLTLDEWRAGRSKLEQKDRRKRLSKIANEYFALPLKLVPAKIVNKASDVWNIFNKLVKKGYEGIMIKPLDARYIRGKRGDWYKFKKVDFEDVVIVGVEEGKGRHAGRLGALIVKDKKGNQFKVGTGFSDYMRDELWRKSHKLKGQVVEIMFMEPSKKAVRFPVFKRLKY